LLVGMSLMRVEEAVIVILYVDHIALPESLAGR
jgi:hypothetical protein